ncbi:hypothetical protein [Alicycliphilus denitrificans]|uniref:hypothetical protein n=1 Tax=Alicycliphilus denitrificans TaxID=179636 RepID=UPI0001D9FE9A|nr:hypothetical protein [Alicycliphilus denitrificans]ADU99039.1 hypothetical protein Alide_1278 [Alicycliphilus denitrificans BC]
MDKENIIRTAATEAAKAAPPVAVVVDAAANSWTMTHTATALTIAYVLLQSAYLIWRWRTDRLDRIARLARESEGTVCK